MTCFPCKPCKAICPPKTAIEKCVQSEKHSEWSIHQKTWSASAAFFPLTVWRSLPLPQWDAESMARTPHTLSTHQFSPPRWICPPGGGGSLRETSPPRHIIYGGHRGSGPSRAWIRLSRVPPASITLPFCLIVSIVPHVAYIYGKPKREEYVREALFWK